jgi:biotin carboxyl carrier protein
MADDALRVGYAEADITPPLGISLAGSYNERKAKSVHDPLKSKVLYLAGDAMHVAVVACDLLHMSARLVERIRDKVRELAGDAAPKHVWVHCTHTHSGGFLPRLDAFTSDAADIYPNLFPGVADEKWTESVLTKTAEAVVAAAKKPVVEKKPTLHLGREASVAFYRRFVMKDGSVRTNPGRGNPNIDRPAGDIDPRVHVLRFDSAKVLTVIYGMHPTTMDGAKISADYPHFLTEVLRHAMGAEWRVVFLNACCGNVNQVNVADPQQKKGPEESKRIGEAIALAALEAMKKEQLFQPLPLKAASTKVACKLRKPSAEELKQAEELLRVYKETKKGNPFGFNEMFAPAVVVLAKTKDTEHQAEIAAMRLGTFGLSFMPGEIFVELGREVEEGSPLRPTRTIGLTNGAMGYIPTIRAYAEGGYEAGWRSARYVPENGHNWARTAAALLRDLAKV